jgi:hypothetical protein
MTDQTPAETLRAAAERLRNTAAEDEWWSAAGGTVRGLAHPSLAPALADWLEREARHHDASVQAAGQVFGGDETARDEWIREQTNGEALAVARAILGEP